MCYPFNWTIWNCLGFAGSSKENSVSFNLIHCLIWVPQWYFAADNIISILLLLCSVTWLLRDKSWGLKTGSIWIHSSGCWPPGGVTFSTTWLSRMGVRTLAQIRPPFRNVGMINYRISEWDHLTPSIKMEIHFLESFDNDISWQWISTRLRHVLCSSSFQSHWSTDWWLPEVVGGQNGWKGSNGTNFQLYNK